MCSYGGVDFCTYIKYNVRTGGDILPNHIGRPTNNPKTHRLEIRLSDEDVELLTLCRLGTGLPKAEILRLGIRKVYEELQREAEEEANK